MNQCLIVANVSRILVTSAAMSNGGKIAVDVKVAN